MQKTWFITGASRGFGYEIAKAALSAGARVVATGRDLAKVRSALGADGDRLLSLHLDVSDADEVRSAVAAAVARFDGIDVLVNNAGYGHLGFFEETTNEDVQTQLATNLFGVLNVTRAVLPVMRSARRGRIFNLSSVAGLRGMEFSSLYCTSKFALEGFSESLSHEVAPFGIFVTLIEPGPFRTGFLAKESLRISMNPIADYDDRRKRARSSFEERDGQQPGDPAKLAEALVQLADEGAPPMRLTAGAYAVRVLDEKLTDMRAELETWRRVSLGMDY
ncbi:oxidoreductase [Povalibacter sp.]|uniref:oxidoreductase n=1 Tax=Povalibacter sp. TaxID=1962978 RepID=UPI002F401D93